MHIELFHDLILTQLACTAVLQQHLPVCFGVIEDYKILKKWCMQPTGSTKVLAKSFNRLTKGPKVTLLIEWISINQI